MRKGELTPRVRLREAKYTTDTRLTLCAGGVFCLKARPRAESRRTSREIFKLEDEDVKKIDGLDKKMRFNDPSSGFGWNFYADLDGKESS